MTTSITRRPCVVPAGRPGTRAVPSPSGMGGVSWDGPTEPREAACNDTGAFGASRYARVFEEYAASKYEGLGHLFIG